MRLKLIWRGYELHTPKSVSREGSKAWALSVVPHFSLSPPRLSFLAWGVFHASSCFARSTIPEEKWGTTRSLAYTKREFSLAYMYSQIPPLTRRLKFDFNGY